MNFVDFLKKKFVEKKMVSGEFKPSVLQVRTHFVLSREQGVTMHVFIITINY